jgi:hypothetical protein
MSKVASATSDGEHGFAGQQAKGVMQGSLYVETLKPACYRSCLSGMNTA